MKDGSDMSSSKRRNKVINTNDKSYGHLLDEFDHPHKRDVRDEGREEGRDEGQDEGRREEGEREDECVRKWKNRNAEFRREYDIEEGKCPPFPSPYMQLPLPPPPPIFTSFPTTSPISTTNGPTPNGPITSPTSTTTPNIERGLREFSPPNSSPSPRDIAMKRLPIFIKRRIVVCETLEEAQRVPDCDIYIYGGKNRCWVNFEGKMIEQIYFTPK